MATKTISIEIDVYDRLKALKQTSSESFSQVLRRELSPPRGILAKDLLRLIEDGSYPQLGLTDDEVDAIESIDSVFLPEVEDCA
jgi:predicted CopG family antitoxin